MNEQERRFIGHLEKLVKEQGKGALANLRRGLGKGPGTVRVMDPHVLPYTAGLSLRQEEAYYIVGALFAMWYQGKESVDLNKPLNLGSSMRILVKRAVDEGSTYEEAEERIGKYLSALLDSHPDELPEQLRHAVSLLKAKEIPVNWLQLLDDIQYWHREGQFREHNWARSFWQSQDNNEEENKINKETK